MPIETDSVLPDTSQSNMFFKINEKQKFVLSGRCLFIHDFLSWRCEFFSICHDRKTLDTKAVSGYYMGTTNFHAIIKW